MKRINIQGYEIEKNKIAPIKARLQPLLQLVAPTTLKEYARWIMEFSSKIKELTDSKSFPLLEEAMAAFELLKKDLGDVTRMSIDEDQDFVVDTDASNVAISATRNQNGKPVVFFSKTLNAPKNYTHLLKK